MNLYAIRPVNSPDSPRLALCESDEQALRDAVFDAAIDATAEGGYGSTSAEVWLVAAGVKLIGHSRATDAPKDWEWAHPGVENAAAEELLMSALDPEAMA